MSRFKGRYVPRLRAHGYADTISGTAYFLATEFLDVSLLLLLLLLLLDSTSFAAVQCINDDSPAHMTMYIGVANRASAGTGTLRLTWRWGLACLRRCSMCMTYASGMATCMRATFW